MSELVTMYPAQANSPETSLSGALTAAGTTVNVVDGSVLPEAPNLLTIGADGSTAETVLMTEKNGNVLTVTRAQNGTTARAWSAGDVIARYFTAADQTAIQERQNNTDELRNIIINAVCSENVYGEIVDKIIVYDDYMLVKLKYIDFAFKIKYSTHGYMEKYTTVVESCEIVSF